MGILAPRLGESVEDALLRFVGDADGLDTLDFGAGSVDTLDSGVGSVDTLDFGDGGVDTLDSGSGSLDRLDFASGSVEDFFEVGPSFDFRVPAAILCPPVRATRGCGRKRFDEELAFLTWICFTFDTDTTRSGDTTSCGFPPFDESVAGRFSTAGAVVFAIFCFAGALVPAWTGFRTPVDLTGEVPPTDTVSVFATFVLGFWADAGMVPAFVPFGIFFDGFRRTVAVRARFRLTRERFRGAFTALSALTAELNALWGERMLFALVGVSRWEVVGF